MNIFSKLTLYDFLCMMVTGFLILWPLCKCVIPNAQENILFFVLCYLVGIVYNKIMEYLMSPLRNVSYMIEKGKQIAANSFQEKTCRNAPEGHRDYYEAYYFLIKKNCLNVIPILEAQVAFIKSVYPILLIYTICLLANCICLDWLVACRCQIVVVLVVLIVILPFVCYNVQIKIYELVWEGFFYIQDLKKAEKNEEGTD